jgi:hypothetical protein
MICPAYAYIDPGSGSLILQALIGAFAVGAGAATGYWRKAKTFFGRLLKPAKSGRD